MAKKKQVLEHSLGGAVVRANFICFLKELILKIENNGSLSDFVGFKRLGIYKFKISVRNKFIDRYNYEFRKLKKKCIRCGSKDIMHKKKICKKCSLYLREYSRQKRE